MVTFSRPIQILWPYVDRYWAFDNREDTTPFIPPVTPGVGTDLFIHFSTPFMLHGGPTLASSHIIFSGTRLSRIVPSPATKFIAIRFRAGALKNFTNIPLQNLQDSFATAEDLWGMTGKHLVVRLQNAVDIEAATTHLDQFLMQMLDKYRKGTKNWDLAVDKLYHGYDSTTIDMMSKEMNLSNRHLRRRFIEETGFSPKHFQQLARFHSVLKSLLLTKTRKYLSIALDGGYFDQTHFIKEFRFFMGCAPTDFLQKENFMSHFYYPGL